MWEFPKLRGPSIDPHYDDKDAQRKDPENCKKQPVYCEHEELVIPTSL